MDGLKLQGCVAFGLAFLAFWPLSGQADVIQRNKVITDYFTAFLNITYFDQDRGVFHTERTETGRFSTNTPKDFSGKVVIITNQKESNESETIYTGII